MAAIITNKFRINNAEQFVESFSETSAETYYLFIGRAHAWASDADVQGNTIAEGTDASPPTPNDDVTSEFYNYDDMLGAKLITSSDVSHCIPRRNWTTGTTYDMYEHNISSDNTSNSGATNLYDSTFVVMNSSYAVYKVIENDGATASTVEPTSTSNSIFETSDGYRWKYMYSLTSAETLNFMSTDFIYEDLESRDIDDDKFYFEGETKINGHDCAVISSTPVKESYYWGKKIFVDTEIFRIRKVEYFSENNELEKTLYFKDIVKREKYWFPKTLEMQKPNGNYTIMKVEAFKPDTKLDDAIFTESFLSTTEN